MITADRSLTWERFDKRVRHDCDEDRTDDSIFYTDRAAKIEGTKLRKLTCLIHNCQSRQNFPNNESLLRHMETTHQKTFCKICMKGRTVFIREQRIYHTGNLRRHIEHGDPASANDSEILPHPWCDFCEEYFFDNGMFSEHLHKMHLACHLCGENFRHMFYDDYESLETHFSRSHFICPFPECRQKCYVAF